MIWIRMNGFFQTSSTRKRVIFMSWYLILCVCVPVACKKHKTQKVVPQSSNQTEVIQRLSNFFGIDRIPGRIFKRSPPDYMMDLYKSITDSGGLMKRESPYKADVIRSFPDRQWNQSMHFSYNISYLSEREKILAAEFHVFKMRPAPPSPRETKPPYVIEIKIYQVLDPVNLYSINGLKLLDARRVSALAHGWYVFNVKKAVEAWVNGTAENYGFLVSTTTVIGHEVNGSYIRFAQRHQHHDSKQPILVVYTDDGMSRHPNYISPNDEDYLQIKKDIMKKERAKQRNFQQVVKLLNERERDEYYREHLQKLLGTSTSESIRKKRNTDEQSNKRKIVKPPRKKRKRSKEERKKRREERKRRKKNRKGKKGKGKRALDFRYRKRRGCAKHEMYVDFDEIGWSGWIISPKGYNAYHCKGSCPFPLGQSQKPTNHATVQSIVHALKVGKDVSTPCCVPNKLYSISLLYFDDDENVILKQYDEMVAASCGCH
ncbi:bone morphogenetic protein 2-B-like [Saccostrea echinata]|uniref:bone morphogenetic protein 2-B-like n=1 Tax=Saccostrea echinata TaxID=191078 RepID=UPI002A815633|nr:bone morphogenetic protein 2-B-like [Saccostrea echinata]